MQAYDGESTTKPMSQIQLNVINSCNSPGTCIRCPVSMHPRQRVPILSCDWFAVAVAALSRTQPDLRAIVSHDSMACSLRASEFRRPTVSITSPRLTLLSHHCHNSLQQLGRKIGTCRSVCWPSGAAETPPDIRSTTSVLRADVVVERRIEEMVDGFGHTPSRRYSQYQNKKRKHVAAAVGKS